VFLAQGYFHCVCVCVCNSPYSDPDFSETLLRRHHLDILLLSKSREMIRFITNHTMAHFIFSAITPSWSY
jgi:hypothetical protein